MFSLPGTSFHQVSTWLALSPLSSLCAAVTFTVNPILMTLSKKSVTHPENSPSPFHTLFSPTHLSPSNIHNIFPSFSYCLILFHCQNVKSMKARIFVCLVHCYVPSTSYSTWHVVGTFNKFLLNEWQVLLKALIKMRLHLKCTDCVWEGLSG